MAPSARVRSIEALVTFKAALSRFAVEAGNALATLGLGVRRSFEWLEAQEEYWRRELRRREELASRARAELLERQYNRDEGRGTTEAQLAFRRAQERLHEAEAALKNCRRWAVALPREMIECEGPARLLAGMLEADLRRGVALLEQKIRTLEAYVALAPPQGRAESPPTEIGEEPPGVPESPAAGTVPSGTGPGGPNRGTPTRSASEG